uniref:DUF4795 domain-containing protein n=1 Tax=Anopheles christyi TaxID=43041 RepID=A0A182JRE1_9DIPT
MVSSSESGDVLVEELNRQLGEAFGTSGGGCINIKALHKLLTSLIDFHIRYEAEKQQNKSIGSNNTGGTADGNNLVNGTTSGTSSKTVIQNPYANASKELRQEVSGPMPPKSMDNNCQHVPKANDNEPIPANNECEKLDQKEDEAMDVTPEQNSNPFSVEEVPTQRSSDFLAKSTTSTSEKSDTTASTSCSSTPNRKVESTVPKKTPLTTAIVEDKTPAQDNSTQTAIEFCSILEGCKDYLETVKQEIVALKIRCQSQHEDTLKLAGALDNLVYRVGSQEPKVEKLETDNHCFGMLISDYEMSFKDIEKHLERHDVKVQEIERTFQRMDKERDSLRADLRSANEQANYLATVKADKVEVQTELNRRALVTDMQQRVPYAVYNEAVRDLARTVTQLREELHDVDQNLKTLQYELVKGLASKAAAQDVTQIRKQLTGALNRCQKIEQNQHATVTSMGDSSSAGVAGNGGLGSDSSKCLACGIQTTLEGSHPVVANCFVPMNRIRHGVRIAGGSHTKCFPPEKVFRTGSLGVVKKAPQDEKRGDWKM